MNLKRFGIPLFPGLQLTGGPLGGPAHTRESGGTWGSRSERLRGFFGPGLTGRAPCIRKDRQDAGLDAATTHASRPQHVPCAAENRTKANKLVDRQILRRCLMERL